MQQPESSFLEAANNEMLTFLRPAESHLWDGQDCIDVADIAFPWLDHLCGRIIVWDVQPEACGRSLKLVEVRAFRSAKPAEML